MIQVELCQLWEMIKILNKLLNQAFTEKQIFKERPEGRSKGRKHENIWGIAMTLRQNLPAVFQNQQIGIFFKRVIVRKIGDKTGHCNDFVIFYLQ